MRTFLISLLLLSASLTLNAATMGQTKTQIMLTDVTVTGAGSSFLPLGLNRTFQAIGSTTAGVGASTIDIEVSNNGTNFQVVDTLSLTLGTTVTSDYYENAYAWKYVRGNVKTISGTGAKVSLIMGAQL